MTIEPSTLFALFGFFLAAYAVIGNDAVQTLGTFIASNKKVFPWYVMWAAASAVLVGTLTYGWIAYQGDISFGRLEKFPPIEIQWYHAAAPAILVLLTRVGIPVSTTFLVLSAFASGFVLEKMLMKSAVGYLLAAVIAYVVWMVVARILNEKYDKVHKNQRAFWRTLQWCSTGFLWFSWLSHDMANIAIFLPRALSLELFIAVQAVLVLALAYIFATSGGRIQTIVLEKSGTRFMRSATIIDFFYALILIYFKQLNSIPMSTTWVFVGLLTGRELAIATTYRASYKFGYVFPLIAKDFGKMMVGLLISVALVVGIHYIFAP